MLALVAGGAGSALGQVTTSWNALVDGDWSNAGNWDNGAPVDNGFNAVIALGGAYRVTLDAGFDINDFELSSVGGFLDLNANRLGVEGTLALSNGLIDSSASGGQLEVFGAATLSDGRVIGAQLTFRDSLEFSGSTLDDLCDSDVGCVGSQVRWTGGGDISLDRGASLSISAGTTFQIESDASLFWNGNGARPTFQNDGVVTKQVGAVETFVDGIDFTNAGTLRVESGTLRINRTTNLAGGVLSGGAWEALNGTTLDFDGQTVQTNQALVTLSGAGASFVGFGGVELNDVGGRVAVLGGAQFTATGATFDNQGTVDVGVGSQLTVDPGTTWLNVSANTLSGGEYLLRGTFAADGADIRVVDAAVSLDGAGADIFDPGAGESALRGLERVGSTGALSLLGGRDFTTVGDFEVETTGSLTVGETTTFRVGESFDLVNFVGGVLAGGTFDIRGQVIADNAVVEQLSSDVTLDGAGDRFVNGQSGEGAFNTMTRINADGRLVLRNGHQLTLGEDLVVEGELVIEDQSGGRPDSGVTSVHVRGSLEQLVGELRLAGGLLTVDETLVLGRDASLAGFGTVRGGVRADGSVSPGDGLGMLVIDGDAAVGDAFELFVDIAVFDDGSGGSIRLSDVLRVTGTFEIDGEGDGVGGTVQVALGGDTLPTEGQSFLVLRADRGLAGEFEIFRGLEIGPDLYLQPRYTPLGLRLDVVPSPGGVAALGVLAGWGLARGRRRSERPG